MALASYEIFVTFVPLIYEFSQLSQDYFFTTENTEKTEVIKTQITKKMLFVQRKPWNDVSEDNTVPFFSFNFKNLFLKLEFL